MRIPTSRETNFAADLSIVMDMQPGDNPEREQALKKMKSVYVTEEATRVDEGTAVQEELLRQRWGGAILWC